MQHTQTIFVTGATGNQGGAVVDSLLQNGFKVKALTRNTSSSAALKLRKLNVEIVEGDLNDPAGFRQDLNESGGLFCLLTYENGVEKEIQQGLALADMARDCGIKHFVYSSVVFADLDTDIPHWKSKTIIEERIKKIGLPFTIIRPASLFENFLLPQVRSRILKGKLVSPVNKNVVQQFISSRDIGKLTASIFMDPEKYLGKTIPLAAEEMDMQGVVETFSEVLEKNIVYAKLPMIITRLVMGNNLYKMFNWVNQNDTRLIKDLEAVRRKYPGMLSLKEWIAAHFKTM